MCLGSFSRGAPAVCESFGRSLCFLQSSSSSLAPFEAVIERSNAVDGDGGWMDGETDDKRARRADTDSREAAAVRENAAMIRDGRRGSGTDRASLQKKAVQLHDDQVHR